MDLDSLVPAEHPPLFTRSRGDAEGIILTPAGTNDHCRGALRAPA
jgi:hypothetical protein